MKVGQAIKMAAKSIFSNKARSALTMLGIIIGLAAVIILVSYAEGQNAALKAYYESMGDNRISVQASSWDPGTNVGEELYDYCLALNEHVAGIAPDGNVYSSLTIKYGAKTLSQNRGGWGGMGGMVEMAGGGGGPMQEDNYPQVKLSNDLFSICNGYKLAAGRDLSYLDVEKGLNVCVLGSATAESLFSFANPIDQTITINGIPFRVIGVYESKAGNKIPTSEDEYYMMEMLKYQDKLIVLPASMTRLFNENQPIDSYIVKAKNAESATKASTLLIGFLTNLIGDPNDYMNSKGYFSVNNEEAMKGEQDEANQLQQRFLGGIAAISLLVGGIGIMNIMLVTVTERTREIGIRKAIGAERRSIIVQFLIEAAMICGMGGIIGIGVGYIGTMIVSKISFNTVMLPSPAITVGAAVISVVLGIIFGLYPAIKASGLQPVVALRAD